MIGQNIFIIGFTGAGKSKLAKKLANQLNLPLIDVDIEISKNENLPISEIFDTKGEHYFRHLEFIFIKSLDITMPSLISCGGGLPCYHDLMLWLKSKGKVIWLDTSIEIIFSRIKDDISRPISHNKNFEELKDLYSQRKIYYQMADIRISNETSISDLIYLLDK